MTECLQVLWAKDHLLPKEGSIKSTERARSADEVDTKTLFGKRFEVTPRMLDERLIFSRSAPTTGLE